MHCPRLAGAESRGTIGAAREGYKMRLLIEAAIIAVIVYTAVRMFTKRG
jgi:hypothetical protein